MNNEVMIAPSILSADIANLEADLKAIETADYVHVDVMDGHFVPNLNFGPNIVKAVKKSVDVPADVHLMISNPDQTALLYAQAGADIVTFHIEAAVHAHRLIGALHEAGTKVGVALNPATPVCMIEPIIEDVDMVLVMSVNPGFGGQKFIPSALRKVKQVKALAQERGVNPIIEIDGGVSADNAADVVAAGVNLIVAGSAVYNKEDRAAAILEIREAGMKGLGRTA